MWRNNQTFNRIYLKCNCQMLTYMLQSTKESILSISLAITKDPVAFLKPWLTNEIQQMYLNLVTGNPIFAKFLIYVTLTVCLFSFLRTQTIKMLTATWCSYYENSDHRTNVSRLVKVCASLNCKLQLVLQVSEFAENGIGSVTSFWAYHNN